MIALFILNQIQTDIIGNIQPVKIRENKQSHTHTHTHIHAQTEHAHYHMGTYTYKHKQTLMWVSRPLFFFHPHTEEVHIITFVFCISYILRILYIIFFMYTTFHIFRILYFRTSISSAMRTKWDGWSVWN